MAELPQIVRERLKATPSPDLHPDANVLTAFGERLLPEPERALLLDHLSRCGDCREVVALTLRASEAAEVVTARTVQGGWFGWPPLRWAWVAAGIIAAVAVGVQRFQRHQQANVTVAQVMSPSREGNAPTPTPAPHSVASPTPPRREEGTLKLPSTVTLSHATMAHDRAVRADSAAASSIVASGAALGSSPRPKSKMAMAEAPRDLPFAPDARKSMSAAMRKQAPPALAASPSVSEAVEVQSQSNQIAVEGGSLSPEQNLQTRNVGEPLSAERADAVERAKPSMVSSGARAADSTPMARWTIGSTGSLQRSLDGGKSWQEIAVVTGPARVASRMAESAARSQAETGDKLAKSKQKEEEKSRPQTSSTPGFRAVAAAGLDVWAGGADSMLYHSTDGGEHWTRVLPSANGVVLRGDITRVEFPDPQHGTVSTSSSEIWTTVDGGQSWQKQ